MKTSTHWILLIGVLPALMLLGLYVGLYGYFGKHPIITVVGWVLYGAGFVVTLVLNKSSENKV